MKTCSTCKHRVRSLLNLIAPSNMKCKRPSIPVNAITGKPGERYCSIERRGFGECGRSGVYYEAKV